MTAQPQKTATIIAGIPSRNMTLYHQIRFSVGDPAAWIDFNGGGGGQKTLLILRDIEMARAREHARVEQVASPADFAPEGGLSGNRELATAQALGECLLQHGITHVTADRSLALLYADEIRNRGIELSCDLDLGIVNRRAKDQMEIDALGRAQAATEGAMRLACETIGRAQVAKDGTLQHDGEPLTSARVRAMINVHLIGEGYSAPPSIVAGGTQAADCHEIGEGPLRVGESVIVDIFPRDTSSLYNGDCTRTVVNGEIPDEIVRMHAAVVEAKAASERAIRSGVTAQSVHEATIAVIRDHGFDVGLPPEDAPPEYSAMVHGTGHGVGLEVHEPPLLDFGGGELVVGDALTIEPGVYSKAFGGVRVEDMVIVTDEGCENLNALPEGLDWS